MEIVVDGLSSLPDDILVYILSRMPINYAAATSVLSRRWRFLWTRINRIVIDNRDYPHPYMMYKTLLNHSFHKLTCPKFHAFILNAPYPTLNDTVYFSVLNLLFHQLSQRQVREIGIGLHFNYEYRNCGNTYRLVLNYPHLVVLTLYSKLEIDVVNLANLDELNLAVGSLSCEALDNLIKSSPKLKKLSVYGRIQRSSPYFYVSSQKLEYLNVAKLHDGEFVIDTPNLKHLDLDTGNWEKYHFVSKPSELISARISLGRPFMFPYNDAALGQVREIFRGISNVSHLTIEDGVMRTLKALYPADGSPFYFKFKHVTSLTINFICGRGSWNDVWFSIRCCPNIEYVRVNQIGWASIKCVIELHSNVGCEPLPRFKTIKFNGLIGAPDGIAAISYALSKFETLELLILDCSYYFRKGNSEEELRECQKFCRQVLILPK